MPTPWAGAGSPLPLGSSRQRRAFAILSAAGTLGSREGKAACLTTASPRPALTASLCFPSAADVTSPGGEPGWKKEPPSGFREPDLSPGKPDSERYRNHAAATTTPTIAITRTILNPET